MHSRKATYFGYVACLLTLAICARVSAAEIAISRTSDMSFGQVVTNIFGGTVSISTTGVRTPSGVAVVASSSSSPAVFRVTGDPSTSYAIIRASIALSGTGQDMTLDTFVSNPPDSGLLDGSGEQTIYVGATLHVGPNQQPGEYSGIVDVSVAYE